MLIKSLIYGWCLAVFALLAAIVVKSNQNYENLEAIYVANIERIESISATHFMFRVKNYRESRLEILLDSAQNLKVSDGLDISRPIAIGYVCGSNKDCGKLPTSGIYNKKMRVKTLKIFVHSYDEIRAPE